jgi:hypothetical protein
MSIAIGPSIATSGLILAYDAANTKSYPGSGSVWTDLTGSGVVGTLTGGISYNATNGGSMSLNGTSGYVVTPTVTLNLSGGVSMEMIFNSNDIQSRAQGFMSFSTPPTYINFYSAGNGTLRWENIISGTGGDLTSPSGLTNFTWYHAIGTFYNGVSVLYINGAQVATSTYTLVNYSSSFSSVLNVGVYSGYMAGLMPVAKMYNRALSATEAYQNYYALRGRYGI